MKSHSTIIWFLLALVLAATIWLLDQFVQPAVTGESPLFPGLRTDRVSGLQVIPGGAREISVVRTNQTWQLARPLAYPAQAAAIDGLLGTLEKLTPVTSLSAADMSTRKNADAEFGFDNPQFKLDVAAGEQSWHLVVGNKTAPGDGVYVRVIGTAGAFVTDTAWLQFLPHEAGDWRDTTLASVPDTLDWLVITNGTQAMELRRDATNRLWRMVRPLAARANNLRIVTALQQLRTAQISRFVSDDPKADLAVYGLEPAVLDVWLGRGTNLLAAVHAGKEVSGAPGEMYARREGWNAVVSTPKEPLAPWRGTVDDFRDRSLLELTAPVAEIEVQGESHYTLQRKGADSWTLAGEKFPVAAEQVTAFLKLLSGLSIADFAKDAVTTAGLQSFGLASPSRQVVLRSSVGDTNSVIAQLMFGGTNGSQTYVKRGDEDFIYAVSSAELGQLSLPADYFRDHRIWNFSETNVAQVTLRQNGRIRQMIRLGTNDWSLAAGSQGVINSSPGVEETVHRLGQLTALAWIGRKFSEADMGLTTNSLSVSIELKSGDKCELEFGKEVHVPSLNADTALATVTLDGERWALVFPPMLCAFVAENLTLPADAP
jgi:hypothetical protein